MSGYRGKVMGRGVEAGRKVVKRWRMRKREEVDIQS